MPYQPPKILHANGHAPAQGAFYCIHGMTADSRELLPVAEFLSEQGFTVYLSTLIGHEDVLDAGAAKRLGCVYLQSWLQQVEWELEYVIAVSKGPVFVLGMSFGGLLAMHLAQKYHTSIAGAALLSLPVKFRNPLWERSLKLFSCLPEFVLSRLGTLTKAVDDVERSFERFRLDRYSVGAAIRLMKLRNIIFARKWPQGLPTIVLHAPEDRIVDPDGPVILARYLELKEQVNYFPGGSHELGIGLCYKEVRQLVYDWSSKIVSCKKRGE